MGEAPHSGGGVIHVTREQETNNYVAKDRDGATILGAEAGALNLFGNRVALNQGNRVFFGPEMEWRTEPDLHADGVLFIEEA